MARIKWSNELFQYNNLEYPVFSGEQWKEIDKLLVRIGLVYGEGIIYPSDVLKYLQFQQMIRDEKVKKHNQM